MKQLILVFALMVSACAPTNIQTQQGKTAYTADQIVVRVNELQNVAIAANASTPKALPDATTRVIVQFCVSADATLAQTPAGWQATLKTAWSAAKTQAGPQTNQTVVSAMALLDALIGGLQ